MHRPVRTFLEPTFVLILASLSIFYLFFNPDDYYIYLQYARNLNETGQFAFNPGHPSLGFTSSLWVMLLGAGFSHIHPHWFPKLLSFSLYLSAMLLFWRLLRKQVGPYFALWGTALLCLNPWVWRWSLSGMETTAALLVSILVLNAWWQEKDWLWIPLGLLPLLRPELLVWALAGMLWFLWKRRFMPALLSSLPMGIWLLFSRLTFGSWFPNTAHAKAGGFSFTLAIHALKKIVLTLQPVDLIALVLGIAFLWRQRRQGGASPHRLLLILCTLLGGLLVVKGVNVHTRYLVPAFPLTIALFLATPLRNRHLRHTIMLLSLGFSLFQTAWWVYPSTRAYAESEIRVNQFIGTWLNKNTPHNAQIFLWDIGAISFSSKRHTIDLNGLLDARVFHRLTPFPELVSQIMTTIPPNVPIYLVDIDPLEKRAEGRIPGVRTDFILSRPFHHMFIFQKEPLYYSLYKLHRLETVLSGSIRKFWNGPSHLTP